MSKQTIFARLIGAGMTREGAAALMGNMQCESCCSSCNVEDHRGYSDEQYTNGVNCGSISREAFGRDSIGYGLCQWTYPTRKFALYDYAKRCGVGIDDEKMQIEFCINELKTEFPQYWNRLCTATQADMERLCDDLCDNYENPATNNFGPRRSAMYSIYAEMCSVDPILEDVHYPIVEEVVQHDILAQNIYWPPRTICLGMDGPDVMIAQIILSIKGYFGAAFSYDFDSEMATAVESFQRDNCLTPDKIIGPKTWDKLGVKK